MVYSLLHNKRVSKRMEQRWKEKEHFPHCLAILSFQQNIIREVKWNLGRRISADAIFISFDLSTSCWRLMVFRLESFLSSAELKWLENVKLRQSGKLKSWVIWTGKDFKLCKKFDESFWKPNRSELIWYLKYL